MDKRIYVITVTGKGGHGAQPHLATDPAPALGLIILSLRSLIPSVRFQDIDSGTGFNIIAGSGKLTLEIDELDTEKLKKVVGSICSAQGCTGSIEEQK